MLDHGSVAEVGTHEQLMAYGGTYRRLAAGGTTDEENPGASAGQQAGRRRQDAVPEPVLA